MFTPRNQRDHARSRRLRPALALEVLEDRTLLSAAPTTTILDLNGLSVNPNQYSSTDILVRFQTPPGTTGGPALVAGTTLASSLPLVSGLYEVNLPNGMTVTNALAAYKAEAGVLDAEPDYDLTVSSVPNDPLLSQQWNLNNTGQNGGTPGADIHAEQAWNVTTGSPTVVVAVMDTGIDYDSVDLYQNIWINQAEIPNSWYTKTSATSGYDKLVYKSEIKTATPGIITFRDLNNPVNAGLVWDNNGDGRIDAGDLLRSTSQGGWDSGSTKDGDTAHPDDLFGWNFVSNTNTPLDDNGHGTNVSGILGAVGNNGSGVAGVDWNVQIMPIKFIGSDGEGSVSAFIQGLDYSILHGAKITNNSWEGAPYSQDLYDAIENAKNAGQIFVAAAGNEGTNDDSTPDYPASFSQSLNNVVAVAATDDTDHLASFSNYGPDSVALAAPGVNILSTLPGSTYGTMSGTSMATPEVTGALALVWGLHPTWTYTQVIDQVLDTTDKLPSLQGKVSTGGRLDVAAAVGWNLSTRITPIITNVAYQGPTTGTMNSLVVTFNEAIDVSSFSAANVRLTNTTGQVIPATVSVVGNSGDRQMELTFANQTVSGNYNLSVNSNVRDLMGNPMATYQATITLHVPRTYTNTTPSAIKAWSTTTSTITVPPGMTVGHLQALVNVSYPDDGDLSIYLTSPHGTTMLLAGNLGGEHANFQNTVFDDAASTPIANAKAPYAGTYSSQWGLSQLNGQNAAGIWTLTIKDSGGHSGTLLNWALTITPSNIPTTASSPPASPPPAPPASPPSAPPASPPPASATPRTYTNSASSALSAGKTTTSTLTVPPGMTVGNVQVRVNANYPDDGDLSIYLTSPHGTKILLAGKLGGTSANFQNTIFSDAASTAIAYAKAPYAGTYKPQWGLSQFNGQNAAGTWTLTIVDSGTHSGTLLNWGLTVTPASGSASAVQVSSLESVASSSTLAAGARSITPGGTPSSSGQFAGNDSLFATLAALTSNENKNTATSTTPADQVFASAGAMAQLQTNLLVGKRPSNPSTSNPNE